MTDATAGLHGGRPPAAAGTQRDGRTLAGGDGGALVLNGGARVGVDGEALVGEGHGVEYRELKV